MSAAVEYAPPLAADACVSVHGPSSLLPRNSRAHCSVPGVSVVLCKLSGCTMR